MAAYRKRNKARIAEVHKKYITKWNAKNKDKLLEYGRRSSSRYRSNHKEKCQVAWKQFYYSGFNRKKKYMNEAIKYRIMCAYGPNGLPQCAQCGIHDIDVLTLDHIHNNGAAERKRLKIFGGVYFYKHLEKSGYPDGYQVLCMNCNLKKEIARQRKNLKEKHSVSV